MTLKLNGFLVVAMLCIVSFKASAQDNSDPTAYSERPVQLLMVTASYLEMETREIIPSKKELLKAAQLDATPVILTSSERGALEDLKVSYGKWAKARSAILYFWSFYFSAYRTYDSQKQMTPLEILRVIERLKWLDNYFSALKKGKFLTKFFNKGEIEDLDILVLKNTALIENLHLEIQRVLTANSDKPEKITKLFKGIEIENLRSRKQSVEALSYLMSRISTLEAYAKSCFALF